MANLTTEIGFCSNYIAQSLDYAKMIYKHTSYWFLGLNKLKNDDHPGIKKIMKKNKKKSDELFEKAKYNREKFNECMSDIIAHKNDEEVEMSSSAFMRASYDHEALQKKTETLYKTINAVVRANEDAELGDDNYIKFLQLEIVEKTAIRLLSLINSNIRVCKKAIDQYDADDDKTEDIKKYMKNITDRRV